MGHKCHGCGYDAKSAHGLARHMHAKHGFGRHGLAGLLPNGAKAGDGRGESDTTQTMSTIRPSKTASMRSGSSVGACCSSYSAGDGGGSYGRR